MVLSFNYFKQIYQEKNVKLYYGRPRTPKNNPSLERFNQTIQKEWIRDGHLIPDIKRFNQELAP